MEIVSADRALATVDRVVRVEPVSGADRLDVVWVRGWSCVVPRGQFRVGDRCLYFEPDSFLPAEDDRFSFVARYAPLRVHPRSGSQGYRLRSIRLRGVYSHGLVLPLDQFPECSGYPDGSDVSGVLGVIKWEEPLPVQLAGEARGVFPGWIYRTDEERIQNLPGWFLGQVRDGDWVATEKLDGSSMTVYWDGLAGVEGVCSRNIDLRESDSNLFWLVARRDRLHDWLRRVFADYERVAVQGELVGPGVQGNPLGLREHGFFLFTIQVGDWRLPRAYWPLSAGQFAVPELGLCWSGSLEGALSQVDGLESAIAPGRLAEGVVWRHRWSSLVVDSVSGERRWASFKVIQDRYLVERDS